MCEKRNHIWSKIENEAINNKSLLWSSLNESLCLGSHFFFGLITNHSFISILLRYWKQKCLINYSRENLNDLFSFLAMMLLCWKTLALNFRFSPFPSPDNYVNRVELKVEPATQCRAREKVWVTHILWELCWFWGWGKV